jgi:hypothetical protein
VRGAELDALRTGDLAREVKPGLFRIEGRLARFIKPLGLRISLDELEALAGPGVRVAGNDDRGAVVVAASEADLERARGKLAELDLPVSVIGYHLLDAIPQLGSGKIDYPGILNATAGPTAAMAAQASGPAAIEACFVHAARGAPITDSTTYAQIGGDSLSFIDASIVIETALGHPRDDWATMPLGELKAAAAHTAAHATTATTFSSMRGISPDILVRAVAILLVVLQHAIGTFEGGADVMMVLGGLSWARFQRAKIDVIGVGRTLWTTFARLLTMYYVIILLYSLLKKKLFLSHLLLYSTFLGDWGGSLNIYWFIESLVWCTVVASFAYAAVGSNRLRYKPLLFTAALFVIAIGVRYFGGMAFDAHAHRMRSPDQMLVYFAAGAILFDAQVRGKILAAMILVALSAIAWGVVSSHAIIMAACCALLISHTRLLVPQAAHWLIRLVARNSFYIYVLQIVPMYLVDQILKAEHGRFWPLHVAISVGIGIAMGSMLDRYGSSLMKGLVGLIERTRRVLARP